MYLDTMETNEIFSNDTNILFLFGGSIFQTASQILDKLIKQLE
jgi:hypothetical protein